jgi:hypothetical protein
MIFYLLSRILFSLQQRDAFLQSPFSYALEPFDIGTHLHCVSCGHTALLSDRGECGKGVGGESAREASPCLVRSGRRGSA